MAESLTSSFSAPSLPLSSSRQLDLGFQQDRHKDMHLFRRPLGMSDPLTTRTTPTSIVASAGLTLLLVSSILLLINLLALRRRRQGYEPVGTDEEEDEEEERSTREPLMGEASLRSRHVWA